LHLAEPSIRDGVGPIATVTRFVITTEPISDRVLKITVSEKLNADDFQQLAPTIDCFIKQQGTIRLLVDASNFGGWKNIAAFERHIGFVKDHHRKVERIAA